MNRIISAVTGAEFIPDAIQKVAMTGCCSPLLQKQKVFDKLDI